jgi:hypothetical protein
MIKLDSEYGAMAADKYGAMAMGQWRQKIREVTYLWRKMAEMWQICGRIWI